MQGTPGRPITSRRCHATAKSTGDQCQRWAVRGATVCPMHGGRARQVRKAAARRVDEARVLHAVADWRGTATPTSNPLQELAQMTGEVVAFKNQIARMLDALPQDQWRYSTEYGEQLRAEVSLFERALDRCGKFLAAVAKLDLDERLTRITEQQAETVATVIRNLFDQMHLDPLQRLEAEAALPGLFRAANGKTA